MNSGIAKFYYNSVQRIRGWDCKSAIGELEENQWISSKKIEEKRFNLLHEVIKYSIDYVPYYRKEWNKIGFSPNDIKKESDISVLPIISKDTLRENYDKTISESATRYDIWKSSGSTGEPFSFRLDKNSIIYNNFGALERGRRWWGFNYGQPEGMIWSGLSDVSGTLKGKAEALKRKLSWTFKNIKLVDVYDINANTIERGYKAFLKHQPIVLRAIALGLYRFCLGIKALGIDGKKLGLKGVIYTGEGLSENQKQFIESILGCKTICEYGCTELGIIGFECPKGGIHLSNDNLLIEFIKDGRSARPGEIAELIVTNLRNFTSPLIRYTVGDFVVPSNRLCDCGIMLPLIDGIQGRKHDVVVAPGGNVINGLFFTHLFDKYDEINQFRIIQDDLETLTIEMVGIEKIEEAVIEKIKKIVESKFGPSVNVRLVQVPSIPTARSGKTPWIISKVREP